MPEVIDSSVVSVTINYQETGLSTLYRLKKNTTLHIVPGPSLLGKHLALRTNYPAGNSGFVRDQYTSLAWFSKYGKQLTSNDHKYVEIKDLDMYCEVVMVKAGTFHFHALDEDKKSAGPQGALFIQVAPDILVGKEKKPLKLETLRCQTVLSKCLGDLTTWENKLQVARESGYNLIHFTPIQELAGSRSCYSLADQLKVDPCYGKVTYDDVEKVITKIRNDWGMASICDIVLNHTGNESPWLKEHPESTYSCFTCPHLRPAFLLDALLAKVGVDIKRGDLESFGVPTIIENEDHIGALRHQIHTKYLPMINVHELYQCDINKYFNMFVDAIRNRNPPAQSKTSVNGELNLEPNTEYRRLGTKVDLDRALDMYNIFRQDSFDEDTRIRKVSESLRYRLEELNYKMKEQIDDHLKGAVENALAGVRYERVQNDGPKVREISLHHPVFTPYFTHWGAEDKSIPDIEAMMYVKAGKFFMAHNGWVMNADPLVDFAKEHPGTGNVYLRRELIAWGDSVKLRFGEKPEDSPFLWDLMRKYVEITARIFDGVRLDNCHSTPLHVAEQLIDAARKINPDLYVVAELFTNSDATDNIFVNRLGITSLIREAQAAWDSHEQGRLVYRYGGDPVGAFYKSPARPLAPNIAHAMFLDLTHDNPSPIDKRSVYDMLPSAGVVAMACCATGSNRGYDELVPHHIHVVDEERQYQEWGKHVTEKTGIIAAKRALNELHDFLAENNFSKVYVDQMHPDVVGITRHNQQSHETVILVAHNAFGYPDPNAGPTGVRPLKFEGKFVEIVLEAQIKKKQGQTFGRPGNFEKDPTYINGLDDFEVDVQKHISLEKSKIFSHNLSQDGNNTQLDFVNLKPGSVVVVRVAPQDSVKPKINELQTLINNFHTKSGAKYLEVKNIISKLNLIDLNIALFSCDQEERDMGYGFGAYNIPGFQSMVYAGFQGFLSLLSEIAPNNDLGHPFCGNLRDGDWMIDYIHQRLANPEGTKELSKWLQVNFEPLKGIPRYLIPAYFDVIVTGVYDLLVEQTCNLMPNFIKNGSTFTQLLALATLQFMATVKSANLPELSPSVSSPKPPKQCATLAAGLPHFATGYMRCWGRDTFISLRGVLLLTGRFDEARYIILGFAACLRHGLIPNLLDGGRNARFNCRDAVWWWLYSIQQYVTDVPNGKSILTEKVSRIYPKDDSEAMSAGKYDQTLQDVMQEALSVVYQGLVYRERNAGPKIDEHMVDDGFNNQIGIHPETGFVFGGNDANCGTWMDKMGSSSNANNKGKPSSPRDGSAVELVGLQASVLRFLAKINAAGVYPYASVQRSNKDGTITVWTLKEWSEKVEANFEKYFYVSETNDSSLANKRKIYKDTLGASRNFADYQLRCNFPIALVVAPEMVDPQHAWNSLEMVRKYILGPLGMKTLDPEDWAYRGVYDNSNDSDDAAISHGANYHQGPEWLWPIGFYLRARLIYAQKLGFLKETVADTWMVLTAHLKELRTSPWRGLPELTNANGEYCRDSCRTQAWSVATVLETLYDLEKLEAANKI